MREFRVIDSAVSVEQLRRRLKTEELEQFGEPFTPEFVYDAIRKLPRFSSMIVSRRIHRDPDSQCARTNISRSAATSRMPRNSWASSLSLCMMSALRCCVQCRLLPPRRPLLLRQHRASPRHRLPMTLIRMTGWRSAVASGRPSRGRLVTQTS